MPFSLRNSRWATFVGLGLAAVGLCGFQRTELELGDVKPTLMSLSSARKGVSCGTGSTWAWRTNLTSYQCTKDVAQVAADMAEELRQQGFVPEPNASDATIYRRELPCRAYVRLRKAPEPGETSVYVGYGYPLVTWYGRRIPQWITHLAP